MFPRPTPPSSRHHGRFGVLLSRSFAVAQRSLVRPLGAITAFALVATVVSVLPALAATPPAISGTLFRDVNANDAFDAGEPPLAGVEVVLRDAVSGLVVAGPIITAADGIYTFENLPPGDYVVDIDAPVNYLVSGASPDNAFTPTGDGTTGRTAPITVGPTDDLIVDGLIRPRPELLLGYFATGLVDGSPTFNTTGTCASPTDASIDGDDCGDSNGVLRNNDTLVSNVSVVADNYEPGAPDLQNVIFEQTIFPGPGADVNFDRIPAICNPPVGGSNPPSTIVTNPDGSIVLTCNLGVMTEGAAKTFSTTIVPSGTSENGSTFSVEQRVYSVDDDGLDNAVPQELDTPFDDFTVSAGPAYDLIKNRFHNIDAITRTIDGETLQGYLTYFTFGIGATRAVGVEELQQPISIMDSITAVGPDGVSAVPSFEYYITECRPNPTLWGETVLGVETYYGNSQPIERKVVDSGTCTYNRPTPGDVDSPYELTLQGIDMSGLRYPTEQVNGADLSAGPYYVGYYRVQVFIPYRAIEPTDGDPNNNQGSIQLTNELYDFDPDSPTGTSNFGAGFEPGYNGALMEDGSRSNNIVGPTTYELRVRGTWTKYLRGGVNNVNGVSNPLISGQTGSHSGDGELEPGQTMHGLIPFTNTGSTIMTNPRVCDVFDNSTMVLTNNSHDGGHAFVGRYKRVPTYETSWPTEWVVEYAAADLSGVDPLDNNADGVLDRDLTTGRYLGDWSDQAAVRCSDIPDTDYQTDPTLVPGGIDAVNVVRVRPVDANTTLEPGEQVRLVVPLEARDTFFGGPHAGDPIPTGTVLANYGAVRSDQWGAGWTARNYLPSPETTNGDGDRVTLTRAQIRLQKHTLEPATAVGETGSTIAGQQIVWELIPTVISSNGAAVASNVVITDILPPEASYNDACTASYPGGTPADLIQPNTPSAGYTTLIWNMGDLPSNTAIPPLIICTDSDPLAPNGASVVNYAEMESDNTVSVLRQRSDEHTILLEQVGSIQASKTVDLTLDDVGDDQVHTLGFGNFSANFTVEPPVVIDVLPWNGDGTPGNPNFRDPASDFSGTIELTGPPTVTWFDGTTPVAGDPFPSLGDFVYSADAPSTITLDPDADAAANTTTWCSESGGTFTQVSGPVGGVCPTAWGDVTAFKFSSNYDLARDGDPRQGMNIEITLQADNNEPGDVYTNRFGVDSPSLPAAQFLRSNNVTVRVASYSIGDFVFVDADGDGAFDPTIDVPAPDGVVVELRRPDGTFVASTSTTVLGGGRYLFPQLDSGDYIVTLPAFNFAPGAPLADWVVTPTTGAENDDDNETVDQHGFTIGSEAVDGVTTSTLTLSAIPPGPGQIPVGEEPTGDNLAGITDLTLDDFSNLTLDIGLIGPPDVQIIKEVCTPGSACSPTAAIGDDGWAQSATVPFNDDGTFRITVINTGWQILQNLEVTDAVTPDCDATPATEGGLTSLAPTRSVSWTCTYTNVRNDVLNTASVEGTGLLGEMVSDSDSAEIETPASDPDVEIEKYVNGQTADNAPGIYVGTGSALSFTFDVTNPGTVPLENVEVVDDGGTPADLGDDTTYTIADLVSGDTDGDNRLDPGETWRFGPLNDTASSGIFTNWATVTGDPTNGAAEVTDSDPANAFGSDGGIAVVKYVNGDDADTAPGIWVPVGGAVTWTYDVTNTGNVALGNVGVSDDNATPGSTGDDFTAAYQSGDTNTNGLLDLGETWRFEATGTASTGLHTNIATASGTTPTVTNPDGSTSAGTTLTATEIANYTGVDAQIAIEKSTNTVDADVQPGVYVPTGSTVTWEYLVTNPGNAPVGSIQVTDDNGTPGTAADDVSPVFQSGDSDGDGLLDPGETWTYRLTGPAPSGAYTNLGSVTGRGPSTTNPDGSTTAGVAVSDDDPSNLTGSTPGIQVVKTVNGDDANSAPGVYTTVGGALTWTYTVTNTGTVPLSGVSVADDNGTPATGDDFTATYQSGDTNTNALLDVGETWTYTATGTQPSGQYTNNATATGTGPDTTNPDGTTTTGQTVVDGDPASSYGYVAGIDIEKSINGIDADTAPGVYIPTGSTQSWTYTVTNTGNVALGSIVVTDDAATAATGDDFAPTFQSGDTDADGQLDVGETWIYTATGTQPAGQYTNVADVQGVPPAITAPGGAVVPATPVTDDDPANSFGSSPGLTVVKSVNGDDANSAPGVFVDPGDPITFTYVVTNTGNVDLTGVTLSDDAGTAATGDDFAPTLVLGDTDNDGVLDVGEVWTYTATDTAVVGQYTNTASVSGNAPGTTNPDGSTTPGVTLEDDDVANAFGVDPGIDVVKSVNGDDANSAPGIYVTVSGPLTWTYEVTNTGNIALASVGVNDDAGTAATGDDFAATYQSGDLNNDGLLDVGETWIFTATGTATVGPYENNGVASGTSPEVTNADGSTAGDITVSADDPANHVGVDAQIVIEKSTNTVDADIQPGVYVPTSEAVTWEYVVTNPGNSPISTVRVVDDNGTPGVAGDDVSPVYQSGDTNGDGLLDPTETWRYRLAGNATSGPYTNLGSVTGRGPSTTNPDGSTTTGVGVSDDDPSNLTGSTPGIQIVKAVNGDDANTAPGIYTTVGGALTWTYSVTNTGTVPLSGVTVTDDNGTAATGDDTTLTVADLVSGDTNADGLLDVGETWTFSLSGTQPSGAYMNTATTTGTGPSTTDVDGSTTPGTSVSDDDVAHSYGYVAGIDVEKSVNTVDADSAPGIYIPTGASQTWTYTVTNTGNVALANVTLSDDAGTAGATGDDFAPALQSGDTDGDGQLDVGETWIYTATGTQPAGQYTNLADVAGTPPAITAPDGSTTAPTPVTDDDPANSFGSSPAVSVVKSVNGQDANTAPGIMVEPGDPISFSYVVTNTGNVDLSGVVLTDDAGTAATGDDFSPTLTAGDTDNDGVLDVGEIWTYTATSTATTGQYTNIGDVEATGPTTTNPDGTTTAGETVTDDDPANAYGIDPAIAVTKLVNGADANSAPGVYIPTGDAIVWTYQVTNPGNTALASVGVTDDAGTPGSIGDDFAATFQSGDTDNDGLLDPGETWIFTANGTAVDGPYTNEGLATGTAPDVTNADGSTTAGETVTDDDPANHVGSAPDIDVEKSTNSIDADTAPGVYIPTGGAVTWTYTVTNPGTVPLSDVEVVDDAGTAATGDDWTLTVADLISGDTDNDGLLDPGETWILRATGTADRGPYQNTADATGTAPTTQNADGSTTPGVDVGDDDPSNLTGSTPGIDLVKAVNDRDSNTAPGINIVAGAPVEWTFTATNTGSVPLSDVEVTDDAGTPAVLGDDFVLGAADLASGDTDSDGQLDVGETWVWIVADTAVTGGFVNTADIEGTAPATTNPNGSTTPGVVVTDEDPAAYWGTTSGIRVEKATNGADADTAPGVWIDAGDPVVWTYIVTNTGNVQLADVELTDDAGTSGDAGDDLVMGVADLLTGDTDGDGNLDPDEVWVFEQAGTAASGAYVNLADVSGRAPDTVNADGSVTGGVLVIDEDPSNHFGIEPALELQKYVNTVDADVAPGVYIAGGDPIIWSIVLTNTGNAPLDDVEVIDDAGTPDDPADDETLTAANLASGDTDLDGILDAGESWTWTLGGTALDGPFVNTAAGSAAAPDTTDTSGVVSPGVVLEDDDPAHHHASVPSLEVEKYVEGEDADTATGPFIPFADIVDWTYDVTNTGNVALSDLELVDDAGSVGDATDDWTLTSADVLAGDDNDDGVLDPGETWSFSASGVADFGPYVNVAEVTATAPDTVGFDGRTIDGAVLNADDPAHHVGFSSGVVIEKAVNDDPADDAPGLLVPAGDDVAWTYRVINTSETWLTNVVVTDDQGVAVSCPQDWLAPFDDALGRHEMICTGGPEPAAPGAYVNVGTVTGVPHVPSPSADPNDVDPQSDLVPVVDADGNPVEQPTASDPAHHFGTAPAIELVKEVCLDPETGCPINDEDAWVSFTQLPTGADVTWRLVVTNTGNIDLSNVAVEDSVTPACARTFDTLAPGASEQWTCDEVLPIIDEPRTNEATVVAIDPLGNELTATDRATVASPADLSVTKRLEQVAPHRPGDVVDFEVEVWNRGMRTLLDVTIEDSPASGFELVEGQLGGAEVVDGTLVWEINELVPDERVVLAYQLRIVSIGDLDNRVVAEVSALTNPPGLTDEFDNDTDSITIVSTRPPRPLALTGTEAGRLVQFALALMAGGVLLLLASRRRRES